MRLFVWPSLIWGHELLKLYDATCVCHWADARQQRRSAGMRRTVCISNFCKSQQSWKLLTASAYLLTACSAEVRRYCISVFGAGLFVIVMLTVKDQRFMFSIRTEGKHVSFQTTCRAAWCLKLLYWTRSSRKVYPAYDKSCFGFYMYIYIILDKTIDNCIE